MCLFPHNSLPRGWICTKLGTARRFADLITHDKFDNRLRRFDSVRGWILPLSISRLSPLTQCWSYAQPVMYFYYVGMWETYFVFSALTPKVVCQERQMGCKNPAQ